MKCMFIRSILEYGSLAYMGASATTLSKLDAVQAAAEKLGGFKSQPLQLRREAATISFALKMLNGGCRGHLKRFVPKLVNNAGPTNRRTRFTERNGTQIAPATNQVPGKFSLGSYARGFLGVLPDIWAKLPQGVVAVGQKQGWLKSKSKCVKHIHTCS